MHIDCLCNGYTFLTFICDWWNASSDAESSTFRIHDPGGFPAELSCEYLERASDRRPGKEGLFEGKNLICGDVLTKAEAQTPTQRIPPFKVLKLQPETQMDRV